MGVVHILDYRRTWSPVVMLAYTTVVFLTYPTDDVGKWDPSYLKQISILLLMSLGLLSWCNIYAWLGLVLTNSAFFKTAIYTYLIIYPSVSASTIMAKLHGVEFHSTSCICQHQLISRKCVLQMNHQSGPELLLQQTTGAMMSSTMLDLITINTFYTVVRFKVIKSQGLL